MNRWRMKKLEDYEMILNVDQMEEIEESGNMQLVYIQGNASPVIFDTQHDITLVVSDYEWDETNQWFSPIYWEEIIDE